MKVHLPTINQFIYLLALNVTNAVFQLLLILLLVQHTDASKLGFYFVALSFSVLLSIFVNFGTGQTATIAIKKADTALERKSILAETIAIRFFPFIFSILISFCSIVIAPDYSSFILLTIPIIVAEFINPQVYLIATYNIKKYAILNIAFRIILFGSIYFYRDQDNIIELSLLGTGIMMTILNFLFLQKGIWSEFPKMPKLLTVMYSNAPVMANGLVGQLQQSLFLFALPTVATPIFVSAYGFIDKLISSFRMMVNAYGNAFMPRAATLHKKSTEQWKKNKRQQNIIIMMICSIIALVMFLFPDQLLELLMLGKKRDQAFFEQTVYLIQTISIVPLLIALNLLNVAEVFLEKKYTLYFKGGLALLLITLLSIAALNKGIPFSYAGYYPVLMEGATLLISLLIVQKIRNA